MEGWKRLARIAILAWMAAGSEPAAGADGAVDLIVDGQPRAIIVLPEGADRRSIEAGAARILADHLFLISGARLDIRRESELGAPAVEDGRLAFDGGALPQGIESFVLVGPCQAAEQLGLSSEGLGPGGLLVQTRGNVLALQGPLAASDDGGTRHAVIEFLETLGVRYLWPGELGRVLPRQSTLSAGPLDLRYTPPIGQRRIRFGGSRDSLDADLARLQLSREEWDRAAQKAAAMELGAAWGTWQRLGGSIGIGGGHAGAGLSGGWEKHGHQHPEWFALQADGTRDQSAAGGRWRLCKSNPELIQFVTDSIIARVNQDPSLRCVSLSPNDGGYSSHCLCENCRRLDPPDAPRIRMLVFDKVGRPQRQEREYVALSDRMVWYWNQIAQRVTKVHPDLLFLVEAYSYWSTPPVRERLDPNFVVRYVPSGIEGWEGWRQAGAERIYWRPNILLNNRRDGKLNVITGQLADTMRFMADRGMLATDFDSIIHYWAVAGLNYYATARLTWNPRLTVDQILDSYCRPGFGGGADQVKRYFLRAEELRSEAEPCYSPEALRELRGLLREADAAAGEDATVRGRIAFLRMGLNFTELQLNLDHLTRQAADKDPDVDRQRAGQLLELNYVALRDIATNQQLVIHAPYLMSISGDFARWSPIRGRNYRPLPERLERAAGRTLTGSEDSLDQMRAALGLEGS